MIKIGVTSVQGAVSEHICTVERTLEEMEIKGCAVPIRRKVQLEDVDALTIPGGESTTISKLLLKFALFDRIVELAEDGMPIMGTCAGLVLLAKEGDVQVNRTGTRLLSLMNMAVQRNAFGRQRESFEADISVEGLDSPYHAVFIRAPIVTKLWRDCRPLAKFEERIVMARQGNLFAMSFHPELTDDLRIHRMFLECVV